MLMTIKVVRFIKIHLIIRIVCDSIVYKAVENYLPTYRLNNSCASMVSQQLTFCYLKRLLCLFSLSERTNCIETYVKLSKKKHVSLNNSQLKYFRLWPLPWWFYCLLLSLVFLHKGTQYAYFNFLFSCFRPSP